MRDPALALLEDTADLLRMLPTGFEWDAEIGQALARIEALLAKPRAWVIGPQDTETPHQSRCVSGCWQQMIGGRVELEEAAMVHARRQGHDVEMAPLVALGKV